MLRYPSNTELQANDILSAVANNLNDVSKDEKDALIKKVRLSPSYLRLSSRLFRPTASLSSRLRTGKEKRRRGQLM